MFLRARARWWHASRTNRAVCYLSSVRARCFYAFFTAVADIVVWEHWMIASLCDVVLLVNAFGDTCCALFFSIHTSVVVVNPIPNHHEFVNCVFLPHITSLAQHIHQKATAFFLFRTKFCDCCFFSFCIEYLETLTRNIMESSREYVNIRVYWNSFASIHSSFPLCLK